MDVRFSLLREGVTATSVMVDIMEIDIIRRWIVSSLRLSGCDASRYHFVGCSVQQDISGTDRLEEITGGITGRSYDIINKREVAGSHMEFDLEPHAD